MSNKLCDVFQTGDRVFSLIDFKKIRKGDEGTVLGPCADPNAENRDKRVSVDFGLEKGRANMLAATHIQGCELVGGYRKGDRVVSMIDFKKIRKGDEGTVLGACADPNAENRDERVSVDFGLEKGRANMIAAKHIQKADASKPAGSFGDPVGTWSAIAAHVAQPQPRLAGVLSSLSQADVKAMFNETAEPSCSVSRIEILSCSPSNSRHARMASDMLDQLDQRRAGKLAGIFEIKLPESLTAQEAREKQDLLSRMKAHFKTASWAGKGRGFSNVLPVWHGAGEEAIHGIAELGFASLVGADAEDPGWHGLGRYNALEAKLAALYATDYPASKAPNSRGEWCVLLSAAVVGLAYPITPCSHDFKALPPTMPTQCKFYGSAFYAKCDTHIAGVDEHTMLCTSPSAAAFHEVVSSQDAQLLPLAIVYFKKK